MRREEEEGEEVLARALVDWVHLLKESTRTNKEEGEVGQVLPLPQVEGEQAVIPLSTPPRTSTEVLGVLVAWGVQGSPEVSHSPKGTLALLARFTTPRP